MTASSSAVAPSRRIKLGSSSGLALTVLAVAYAVLALSPQFPWLATWPSNWVLPLTDWVGASLGWFLGHIKPVVRIFSWLLEFPMRWINSMLVLTPWQITVGIVTAIGWKLGSFRLAALGFAGLIFILLSGYWVEAMNTLALVFVSVPLALLVGLLIGLLAYEYPRAKRVVEAVLDVMQTIPTFAYLTPLLLLFGFGPVVGLIASAIYAAPPMARNVLLGLERVDGEIKEAAKMSGGTRTQQLFLVEIPSAARQIMVGINQCLMAALSMVIIAAVIGGYDDIGWEVLLTMRKAQFGQALLAGLVVVVFAVIIDRMSGALALDRRKYDTKVALGICAAGVLAFVFMSVTDPAAYGVLDAAAESVDRALGDFTAAKGAELERIKNGAMFFGLLPLRIGLDHAVLPFTWGFSWTSTMSWILVGGASVVGAWLALKRRVTAAAGLIVGAIVLETGVSQLPWPLVLAGVGAVSWASGGFRLARLSLVLFVLILVSGLWERALLSIYLCGSAVFACAIVGGLLGLLCAISPVAWRILRPVCDTLQTIPLFVLLIPVLMFFQIGEFTAFLAICAYAIVPMVRYTQHGLVDTPRELVEAAVASGATPSQVMLEVRIPYAAPTILLGLNQTILFAFAMLVIAALVGTTGLGQSIYIALGSADVGLGVSSGAAMAILAFVADRIVQGFSEKRRQALGL